MGAYSRGGLNRAWGLNRGFTVEEGDYTLLLHSTLLAAQMNISIVNFLTACGFLYLSTG